MNATRSTIAMVALFVCAAAAPCASAGSDIHWAARMGDLTVLTELLGSGADVNAPDTDGLAPLHWAALHGQADIVALLLQAGGDARAVDDRGRTPLHYAAQSSHKHVLLALLAAGAEVNVADADGETPLHIAARRYKAEATQLLLAAGADARAANKNGLTPLHVLGAQVRVQDERFERQLGNLAEQLIAHGADPAIIADGFPALVAAPPEKDDGRGGDWIAYSAIGPALLAHESNYPTICRRYDLGLSTQGRSLWAIKISDNVDVEEDEPEFKYIATMHGDEVVGTQMCMNLIDHMLSNYDSDPRITDLINGVEIWIVPLMNPDGYDRANRTRSNGQGIDLNRNFPEWVNGDPNTPDGRGTETQIIMNWSSEHSFVASVNFHGGALVVNYPFDNDGQGSVYSPTHDEDMFVYISEQYSQYNQPMWNGNWTHGITNGAAWYSIDGGMQDWNYRYMGCNEVTIELSDNKEPPFSQAGTFWNENRQAMLSYMGTCLIGARGIVTDVNTGEPIAATVTVVGRDHDVYTDPDIGDYQRMLMPGSYDLRFAAAGYDAITVPVTVNSGAATRLDVQMGPSAQLSYPDGGETLTAGVPIDITWFGNPAAQFHVQYSGNYGQSGVATDDFESGTLGPEYTTGGDANWFVSTQTPHGGSYSARAGDINDYDESWMTRTVPGGELSFWYRVSSESNYDWFNFYIDGDRQIHVSGDGSWQFFSTTLAAGTYELKWEYTKDVSLSHNDDTVYIDDLELVDDQTTWNDVIALTEVGATSTEWTPTTPGISYKARIRAYYGGGSYGDWDESNGTFAVEEASHNPGDLDCDGDVDFDDIDPFVLALSGQAAYEAAYPGCEWLNADTDGDGEVDFDDIDAFVALIGG